MDLPIGKSESEKLEFKGRDARPVDLARAAVALLNASGGEIWWGIGEGGGKAIAVEPFADGEARKRDLQNHLIDTIEPSPLTEELSLELVPVNDSADVIRIVVQKPHRQRLPAAQLRDQGRRYWMRVGDRVRAMSREEIANAFKEAGASTDKVTREVLRDREAVLADGEPRFWMRVHPAPELDPQRLDLDDRALWELLTNPAATGNRGSGWNYVLELRAPKLGSRGLRQGYAEDEYVEIQRTGAIEFKVPLDRLHWKGDERTIWPYALLEFPVSLLRLAGKLYSRWGPEMQRAFVDFAFVGLGGWSLQRGSPRFPAFRRPPAVLEDRDLVPLKPFSFTRHELIEQPDACGFRIVKFIYEAFGYGEDAIPPEFDRKTGLLTISGG